MQRILAIDFGGTKIAVGLVDENGHILDMESCSTPQRGPEAAMRFAVELATRLQARTGPATAVGLALPGVVDRSNGMLLHSPSSGWARVPFGQMAQDAFSLPVSCDNDVNACAWAEACFGYRGSEADPGGSGPSGTRNPPGTMLSGSFFWLTISTGIGGAIVADGKVMAGNHSMAGELGHLVVNPGGALCGCGNRGCLEAEAAGPAWRRRALAALDTGLPARDSSLKPLPRSQIDARVIAEGARAGDWLCLEIVEKTGLMLARGLAAVYTILDPETVFIGGGVGQALDVLRPVIESEMTTLVQPALARYFRMESSSLGYDAALLGAAALVLYPY